METLIRLSAKSRKQLLERFDRLANDPFSEPDDCFVLPGHAPFFVIAVGPHVFTFQTDHAVKMIKILEIE